MNRSSESSQLDVAELALQLQLRDQQILSLEEAVRARDEFLSIVAHELRNPMGGVLLQVQNLLYGLDRKNPVSSPKEFRPRVEMLERQVLRLVRRVNTLLDVSRIAAGKISTHLEDCELRSLLNEVLENFRPELEKFHIELQVKSEEVVGRWDRVLVDQIMTNLISNAIKYGECKPIQVTLEAGNSEVRFQVQDGGIGISAEDQARIFQRFERVVADKQRGGFGLGLWITQQIVNALHGEIIVRSQAGKGSTFTVVLPRNLL